MSTRYEIDESVRCRYCGYIADDLGRATDHAEDEHNIVSNAVLDSVEEITETPADVEQPDTSAAKLSEATDDD